MVSLSDQIFGNFQIPPGYPGESHARLHIAFNENFAKTQVDQVVRGELASSWNAILYRFCASVEAAAVFSDSLARTGAVPPMPHRYKQEREFFNLVVNAQACIECMYYAAYAWATVCGYRGFSLIHESERRAVKPNKTIERLREVAPECEVVDVLKNIQCSDKYKEIYNLRIILFHRGLPGRSMSVVVGSSLPSPVKYNRMGDIDGPEISSTFIDETMA
jgi:hypothetical protein